jgi:type I restriction enzyme S subunit
VSRGQGGIRANIGQSDLAQVAMLVPPVTEQRAIAEALSDSDAYIGSLEQLLAKA